MYYTKQNSHQTPPNKTVWLSNNIKPAFLRVLCLNKIETNQNNIIILQKKIKCENCQLNKPRKSDKCWIQNMLQLRQVKERGVSSTT